MKIKFLQIYIFIFFVFNFSITSAQINFSKIKGFIYNEQKENVAEAQVTLSDSDISKTTDDNGYFEFDSLAAGQYSIIIEHVGFEPQFIEKIIVRKNTVVSLENIILREKIFNSDEINISASRIEQPFSKTPTQINRINQKVISRRNAKSSAETLREEVGIAVQKTSHGGGSAIIRGLSSNQILIMVDGIRLNNSTYRLGNHEYLTTVDQFMLDRIEVVRGAMSVLYGSDALGGTINLISNENIKMNKGQWLKYNIFTRYASADQEKTVRGSVITKHKNLIFSGGATIKKLGDLKRGNYSNYNQLERSTNGLIQSPSGFSAYDIDSKLIYDLNSNQTLIAAYQHSRQFNVPRYDKYENNGYYLWEYEPQQRDLVYLKYKQKFDFSFLNQLQASVSYQDRQEGRKIQKDSQSRLTQELDKVGTIGFTMTTTGQYGNHHLVAGMDVYSDKVNSERLFIDKQTGANEKDVRGKLPDNAEYNSFGIFLRDGLEISPKYRVFAGVRYSYITTHFKSKTNLFSDIFKKNFQSVTGNVGFLYNISEILKIKTNYGQAFRAPNLSDFSKFGESKGNIYEIPNLNLQPEQLSSIDLGIIVDNQRFRLNTSVFYSHISQIIESADDNYLGKNTIEIEGKIFKIKSKQNIGRAYITGFEGQIDYPLNHSISFQGNITALYGQKRDVNEPMGGIPPIFGALSITWEDFGSYVQFYSRFAGKQDRLSDDDKDDPRIPIGGTPAWSTFNIRSGFHLTKQFSIQFDVENILDYNYREHGSGINAPGRNFIFSLRLSN